MRGFILLAHGARDAAWAEPMRAIARDLAARRPADAVQLAFLEFAPPTLAQAGAAAAAGGCTHVHVLPLFLGGGGHVRKDVPPMLHALRRAHPQVSWTLHPAAGQAPAVIAALADWADATARREATP